MEQKLTTTYRFLYQSSADHPKVIRLRVRMRDLIDRQALEEAVAVTMKRYPYFCVELKRDGSQYSFVPNERPVIVSHSEEGVPLNSEESNYHMIAFAWSSNWIMLDVFHGMTDGTGAYEVLRTLLYYYCSKRYGVCLDKEGVRLLGDTVSAEEWEDPLLNRKLPEPSAKKLSDALNLISEGHLEQDREQTVYSIAIPEKEFMRFTSDHDGSPGTMIALFFSRAVARLYPDRKDPIRIALCVNQRAAFKAPLAHQCLVGAAMLEYKDLMRKWPIDRQATAYRGMVFLQTQKETVLSGAANQLALTERFIAAETDEKRKELAGMVSALTARVQTAVVSYVGKANYREAEHYIRDFRSWTYGESSILIEIAAVNGQFVLDFIQQFSSPVYIRAFLEELDENGITFDLRDVMPLYLPNVLLPWS